MANHFDNNLIKALLAWYQANRRILPWREEPTPYHVWVSEIMLQQTRVEAVKPYYTRFLEKLPTISALAACPEDELLKLWEGLGYYNRVRNMQKAAQTIMEEYGGEMPSDYEQIRSLKGIGNYTAGAISSIAFGLPRSAVDGNALRIYTRFFEDDRDITADKVKKDVEAALTESIEAFMEKRKDSHFSKPAEKNSEEEIADEAEVKVENVSGAFNQALMDLGATICLPNGAPKCEECPLHEKCKASLHNTWDKYPVKSKAKERRMEDHTVLVISDGERVLLEKREEKGLLAGLYQFPNLKGHLSEDEVLDYAREKGLYSLRIERLPDAKHVFSHIEWHMKAYLVRISGSEETLFVNKRELEEVYAIPSAYRVYTEFAKYRLS